MCIIRTQLNKTRNHYQEQLEKYLEIEYVFLNVQEEIIEEFLKFVESNVNENMTSQKSHTQAWQF